MTQTPFDDNQDVPTAEDAPDLAGDEIARLQAERNDLMNRLARTQAEFQNARKRLEADKDQSVQYANSSLIRSLLPVIDNFERALNIDPAKTDVAKLLKGMQIVHDQWLAELGKQQVELIAPEPGAPFDPLSMQALMQQPTDKYPENHVTQLLQKGYSLHGRVLRPAQVAVSKGH
jgi:molecular chaperone GrpE